MDVSVKDLALGHADDGADGNAEVVETVPFCTLAVVAVRVRVGVEHGEPLVHALDDALVHGPGLVQVEAPGFDGGVVPLAPGAHVPLEGHAGDAVLVDDLAVDGLFACAGDSALVDGWLAQGKLGEPSCSEDGLE